MVVEGVVTVAAVGAVSCHRHQWLVVRRAVVAGRVDRAGQALTQRVAMHPGQRLKDLDRSSCLDGDGGGKVRTREADLLGAVRRKGRGHVGSVRCRRKGYELRDGEWTSSQF